MFDIRYFKNHPEVFYSFAHQIYPSNFTPSPCHRWIKTLEDKGKVCDVPVSSRTARHLTIDLLPAPPVHARLATAQLHAEHRQ
jgi:hypothetical protein